MKIIAGFLLLSVGSLYAHSNHSQVSEAESLKKTYAKMYANSLIKEFDKELDRRIENKNLLGSRESVLDTELYSKILSSRSYIENRTSSDKQENSFKSLVEVSNFTSFKEVIKEIDQEAIKIKLHRDSIKSKSINKNTNFIYPSMTTAGNLTGNTFPKDVWSLTFDDGPRGQKTRDVVDNLYSRGIKATFYMLTREAKKYSDTAKYVVDAGMNIALHSYTHKNLPKQNLDTMKYEITTAKKDLEELLNVKTSTFRLPYGSGMRNKDLRGLIEENNYVHIFWNIDTLDWKDKDPKSILERVKKQMKLTPNQSGIILFHDIHTQSVIASELTMDYLLENDKKICTVEEVIDWHNGKEVDCVK